MKIHFAKYQGTGNDFVMLDNLDRKYNSLSIDQIKQICDRRFGIGADGLIKINKSETTDFEVDYYNSDGSKSFCGNGARCSVAFAETLGINVENTKFSAIDGIHFASKKGKIVSLDMNPVTSVSIENNDFVLNTGSPHFVRYVDQISGVNVFEEGQKVRYSDVFEKEGINVNFVHRNQDHSIEIATYERGVEDETLSCGTGATACALVEGYLSGQLGKNEVKVKVKGGELSVKFNQIEKGKYIDIQLIGPAEFVFKGEMDV